MKTMPKFIAAAALVATLGIGAASTFNNAQPAEQKAQEVALLTRKVNEYEGQHRKAQAASLTRKVNEYEGQHRIMAASLLTRKVNEYEGQHR